MADGRPRQLPDGLEHGTLNALAADYLRTRAPAPAPVTIYTTEESYRLRIAPSLGDLPVRDLSRERVGLGWRDAADGAG